MKILYNLKEKKNIQKMESFYYVLLEKFNYEPPVLDPVKDMEINDEEFNDCVIEEAKLKSEMQKLGNLSDFELEQWSEREKLRQKSKEIYSKLRLSGRMILNSELKNMKRVLRRMDYINKDDVVQTKGRMACEI